MKNSLTRLRLIGTSLSTSAVAVGLLLLASFLISCGTPTETPTVTQKISVGSELAAEQLLNRQVPAAPRTLDLSLATDAYAIDVLTDVFEGLVAINEEGQPIPGVASSWETSTDGKT